MIRPPNKEGKQKKNEQREKKPDAIAMPRPPKMK
jgi:hypothetical protein